jgi:amino acid adenylation domain-containing protein
MMERSVEMVVALLGVLKAGGAYVPIDPEYPQERVRYMLEDSGARVLLTEAKLAESGKEGLARVVCVDSEWERIAEYSDENVESGAEPGNLAYVIYTSGSTGEPKGTLIPHFNVVRLFEATRDWFQFDEKDVWTLFHSYGFDFSVWEMWGALLHGGRLVVVPRWVSRSPEVFYDMLATHRVTVLNQTPSAFYQLIQAEQSGNASPELALRMVIFGGEALDIQRLKPWIDNHGDRAPQLVNMYGITETTVHVTYRPLTVADVEVARSSLIGGSLPDLLLYILDRRMRLVPIGVPGELCVGGAGLSRGYLNRADLTAEKFIPDPFSHQPGACLYKSGDLARRLPDGDIEYLGRIDHQVKIRGFRIELGEIESVLKQHPHVREVVVMYRADVQGEHRLVCYVVGDQSQTVTTSDLYDFSSSRLPDYMVPSAFVMLDGLPLTANGKVDRRALPAPSQTRPELQESFVAPRTLVEEILAGIWADILSLSQVGIHDNFFELGGHSLLATQVVSRLRHAFSTELPLRTLFESPTVAALAAHVETSLRSLHASDIPPLRRVARENNLPLSFAQQRLWFIDQLEPYSSTYNIASALRLSGSLDVKALERALSEVITRHETLQTTFPTVDSQPVQLIAEPAPFLLPVVDLLQQMNDASADERQREATRLAQEEAQRPFDLSTGPLFRATLLKVEAEEHIALVTMHHIISDGWSIGILIREVATLYAAFSRGEASRLAPLAIQYADYAAWQREWLQGDVLEQQLSYWREHLAGAPPVLELPTDHPRPPVQSFRGARHRFSLNGELTQALTALSRREGATLFMTLLAAFKTLLYRYSEQESIVVGTPIAGRTEVETEELIGFFVNTLVLRTEINAEMSVREVIERVKEGALGGYGHQEVPFEKLVEEMAPERSLSHTPLFQVMFVMQNEPRTELEMSGVGVSAVGTQSGTAKFDVTMAITEAEGGLRGGIEYNTDIYEAETIERMAGHFERILESMVERPEQRVGEIEMLTEDEQHQLLVEWNETEQPLPTLLSVATLFEAQVERTPDAVAVVFEDEHLTYKELNGRANLLAHHLRAQGVGCESLVALSLPRSSELIVVLIGILKAGGAYLPLDAEYPQERLSFMLRDAAPSLLLTKRALLPAFASHDIPVVCIDDVANERANDKSVDNLPCVTNGDNLAYVMYTSGSTGQPKGTAVTHRNVVRLVYQARYAVMDSKQVFLQFAPISFDASTFEIWGCLLNGGRLVVMASEKPSLEELGRVISQTGVTTLWLTAGLFHLMVDERLEDLSKVEQLLAGGDVLSASHVRRYIEASRGRRLINGYGPTESTTFACCYEMTEATGIGETVPIGRPINNTKAYVLDRNLRMVARGVVGELYLGGAGVARGYLHRPELTAERFVPDPFAREAGARLYRTGDRVRVLADGNIEYLGRRDGQVKVRGFRIELGEIEAVLAEHDSVREAVVVAGEGTGGGTDKRLVAYVVGARAEGINVGVLRGYVEGRLPQYMVPSVFVEMESLPLTPNGKVDRRALPEPEQSRPELESSFVAPETELEQIIAGIWREVLEVERVGVHDGFFDLGGHSLLLAQAHSRLRNTLNRDISMVDLFKYPTISALAKYLSEEKDSTDEQNVAEDATAGDERGELRREAKERQAQSRRKRQEMRKQKEGQDEQARHV